MTLSKLHNIGTHWQLGLLAARSNIYLSDQLIMLYFRNLLGKWCARIEQSFLLMQLCALKIALSVFSAYILTFANLTF